MHHAAGLPPSEILGIVALLLCSAMLAVWYRFRWWWMPALGAVLLAAAWLSP